MPFSGGSFSLYATGNPVVTGTTISSSWANDTLTDIATGLSTCVLKDGSQTVTANIPMAGFKFTGLGAGSATGNSVRYEQVILITGVNTFTANQPMGGFILTGLGAGAATGNSLRYEQVFTTGNVTLLGTLQAPTTVGVGAATPAASGAGVTFPGTQSASTDVNTLDDYEEGTWTPVLTFTTAGDLNVAYTTQVASYTKIGRVVTVEFNIVTSTFTHTTASGNCRVTGLPFTSANTTGLNYFGGMQWSGVTAAGYTDLNASVGPNTNYLQFALCGSAQVATVLATGGMPTGGSVILAGSCTFHV